LRKYCEPEDVEPDDEKTSSSSTNNTTSRHAATARIRDECFRARYWILDSIDDVVEMGYAIDSLRDGGGAPAAPPADAYATDSDDEPLFPEVEAADDDDDEDDDAALLLRDVDAAAAGDAGFLRALVRGSMTSDSGENLMVFFLLESGESSTAKALEDVYRYWLLAPLAVVGVGEMLLASRCCSC
jgi:hypothetical protein